MAAWQRRVGVLDDVAVGSRLIWAQEGGQVGDLAHGSNEGGVGDGPV